MIDLASALTLPIAKLLLKSWLGESVAVDIGDSLLKLGFSRFGDWAKARTAEQRANQIAGAVVKDLEEFFTNERVKEAELFPAAVELGETVRAHVGATFLVSQELDAKAIAQSLLDARPIDQIYRPAEPECGLYVRLVEALAPRLRTVAPELPGYELERDAILLRMAKVADDVDARLRAIEPLVEETGRGVRELVDRPKRLADGYEAEYLRAVCTELDYVEILGIEELDSKSRRAGLTIAYLSLTARLSTLDDQHRIDFATALTLLPLFGNRLWVEGGAGTGKSTLVRWTALQAARWRLGQVGDRDILDIAPDLDRWLSFLRPTSLLEEQLGVCFVEHPETATLRDRMWRARLPLLVFLRNGTEGLKLEELPRSSVRTAPKPPEAWFQETFANGGAGTLLIFDGVDEVPAGRKREQILTQICNFSDRFPNAQIVVTSRPGAVEEGKLEGFQKVELEDLSEPQRYEFIDHWHRALAANFNRRDDDAVLVRLRQAALRELERQSVLALLGTNPLLCAAICALHWLSRRKVVEEAWQGRGEVPSGMQGAVLPDSLWNVCEALTRMLIHQRDLDRELGGAGFGVAYNLSYEQKREILARIAYGMVASDLLSTMARQDARAHVEAALVGFRNQVAAPPDAVLRALLERTGVLRGSGEDSVEFVHNTLKAFFAAKFYLSLLTPDEMVRRIAAGSSRELASGLDELAVFAAASPDHPAYAQRLIDALLSRKGSRSDIRKFEILALRCEAAASSHLPHETRARVRALAPKLFPPRDVHEARQLAALGDEAVAHLDYHPEADASTTAAAVHCLRLIGTATAQEAIRAYLATESLVVAEELIHDHNPLEIKAVLKAAQDFASWNNVPPTIKMAVRDLAPLADLTDLRVLDVSGTQIKDARPLANHTKLQGLYLADTQVEDAAPLANLTNLQELSLVGTQVTDLTPLANLTKLRLLYLYGTPVSQEQVAELKRSLRERQYRSVRINGP